MNVRGKISSKGQVVVPKDIRDRLGLLDGSEVEFVVKSDSVAIKPVLGKEVLFPPISAEDFLAKRFKYTGKSVSVEDMNLVVETEAGRRWHAENN